MTMIRENGTMGNGTTKLHLPSQYGEMAPVLDDAFEQWSRADVAADYHGYRDEARNDRADARWVRYLRLKAKALRMHQERPRGLYAECDAPNESLTPPWIRQDGPATYSAPRKGGVREVQNVR